MTGNELKQSMINFGGISVNDTQMRDWITQCMVSSASELGEIVRVTLTNVVSDAEIALPADFLKIIDIMTLGKSYKKSPYVTISPDNYIRFPEDLTSVTIVYRKIPSSYVDMTTQLPCHPLIHPHVVHFLLGLYFEQEGEGDTEESNVSIRSFNRWEYEKAKVINTLANLDGDNPVVTQDGLYKRARYHHPMGEGDTE